MERIAEPDLMDDAEQAEAYATADFSEPHDAFVAHFRARFPAFATGEVLDLGCGPADVSIRFCQAYPGVRLTGVDGAEAMLAWGRRMVAEKGLAHRLALRRCYLPDEGLGTARFDGVISNSLLHHLQDPAVLWQTVRQAARSGSPVLVMDLMRPASPAEAERLAALYAAGAPAVLRRDFYHSLFAAYRPAEVEQQLAAAGLSGFRVEAVSDRHLLAWGTL